MYHTSTFYHHISTLCVIGFVIIGYVEAVEQKSCHDCMPYKYCRGAKEFADSNNYDTIIEKFNNSFCGFNIKSDFQICCSEFYVPRFTSRVDTDTHNTDTGVLKKSPNIKLILQNAYNVGHKPKHSNSSQVTDKPNVGYLVGSQNTELKNPNPNNKLLPESCGEIALDRIIGGTDAKLYEFPWMVLIAYEDKPTYGCAGSLINSRYVLTAAHCLVNKAFNAVRIGDFDLQTDIDCQYGVCEKTVQDRQIDYDIVHDDYDITNYKNDIALLRLKVPVDMPLKNANSICLPNTPEIQNESIVNKQGTVAGWGLTEYGSTFTVLKKVDIPVRSPTFCSEHYSHFSEDSNQFCAGIPRKDSCQGDSGGPLIMKSTINGKDKYVQYGIVSYGKEECGTSTPGIYTDVRKYMNWILDNIKP